MLPADAPRERATPPVYEGTFEPMPGQTVRHGRVQWAKPHERGTRVARAANAPATRGAAATRARASSSGLAPYAPSADAPWDRRRALHLLRRTGFGATRPAVDAVLALSPRAAVDAIVDGAAALGPLARPDWVDVPPPHWTAPAAERQAYSRATSQWANTFEWETYTRFMGEGATEPLARVAVAFRERMTLFWSGHFVTHWGTYFLAGWLWRYWSLLRTHALGDFRQAVHDIGINPAMLVYLNGIDNRVWAPNENYARELLELFTMGITAPDGSANYTEADIQELSRVLTGWGADYYGDLEAHFIPDWHDGNPKTVFGQTANWSYDDVVPLLFGARGPEIAHFICRKLYRHFVYAVPDEAVVAEMAALFQAEDWQIAPVVKALLNSAHFHEREVIGTRIKSPVENNFGFHTALGRTPDPERRGFIWWTMWLAGQVVFEPPTVAGWPGYREWVDTGTLAMRWLVSEWYANGDEDLRAYALTLPGAYDAAALVTELSELMLGQPLSPEAHAQAVDILLNGIPAYEWDPNRSGAVWRIRALAQHLGRLPEHLLV